MTRSVNLHDRVGAGIAVGGIATVTRDASVGRARARTRLLRTLVVEDPQERRTFDDEVVLGVDDWTDEVGVRFVRKLGRLVLSAL